jgi:hypothetical protein
MVSLITALSTATVVRLLSYANAVFILFLFFFFFLLSNLGALFHGRTSYFRAQAYRYASTYKDISSNITEPLP